MTNKGRRPWISVVFGESPMLQPEYVAVGSRDMCVQLKGTDVQVLLLLAHHA